MGESAKCLYCGEVLEHVEICGDDCDGVESIYTMEGNCPKCKKHFTWEEHYTWEGIFNIEEITNNG